MENVKKIEQIGKFMSEAPKMKFNVNVFKSGVTLDMPAEEIAADEGLVQELANFLKSNSVKTLIHSMKQIDGTPNDSDSVEQIFHQHGVNMRYLGHVLTELKAQKITSQKKDDKDKEELQFRGDFSHLITILEKEILLRSSKHVFNQMLRDECDQSDLYLSKVISHLLNCLLAPFPQLEQMNEGNIKFTDDSLQTNFAYFPEETFQNRSRGASFDEALFTAEAAPEEKVAQKSKKSLKR